jgi:hypothetical protein
LTKKPGIAAAVKIKFAKDADMTDVIKLLDALDGEGSDDSNLGVDDDPSATGDPKDMPVAEDDEDMSALIVRLKALLDKLEGGGQQPKSCG